MQVKSQNSAWRSTGPLILGTWYFVNGTWYIVNKVRVARVCAWKPLYSAKIGEMIVGFYKIVLKLHFFC